MLCYVRLSYFFLCFFFFQAEDGIRDLVRSRGLGDVYKRQLDVDGEQLLARLRHTERTLSTRLPLYRPRRRAGPCLLYTSDAADERSSVDLGGRRIIKKKKRSKCAVGQQEQENSAYMHTKHSRDRNELRKEVDE